MFPIHAEIIWKSSLDKLVVIPVDIFFFFHTVANVWNELPTSVVTTINIKNLKNKSVSGVTDKFWRYYCWFMIMLIRYFVVYMQCSFVSYIAFWNDSVFSTVLFRFVMRNLLPHWKFCIVCYIMHLAFCTNNDLIWFWFKMELTYWADAYHTKSILAQKILMININ